MAKNKKSACAASQRKAIEHSVKRAGKYIRDIMRTDGAAERDAVRVGLTEIMHYCSARGFGFSKLLGSAEEVFMEEIDLAFGEDDEEDDDPAAPLFLNYKGVGIYHVLKHGSQGPISEFWYSTSEIGNEACQFDIRELPTWDGNDPAGAIKQAIARGILQSEIPWKSVGAKRKKRR